MNEDPVNNTDRAAESAADYIEELLDAADLDGDIDYGVIQGRPFVELPGGDCAQLIGRHGEGIDALQMLTRLAVRASGFKDVPGVVLDIDGYRDAQRQGLFVEAEEALDRVRETGEPVVLRPMNPFERAAVHSRVAEEEGFTSESAGLPPMRSVVVSRETSDGAVR